MNYINKNIDATLRQAGLKQRYFLLIYSSPNKMLLIMYFRPNASAGFWVSFLLPTAVLLALLKNARILSFTYKLATISSAGLIISNIILITQCIKHKSFKITVPHYFSTIFTLFLFYTCLHNGNS